ncbi:glyoxalase superfamily protein [Hoeflea prorocentri]|uniref:Bleomycin resistance protein n=1 Tax=Hoeflea prorocentri TaxID=1922333 RepID=A0A9X3UIN0_9HYPH|nr:glyoxalase superfamily protein [Hoeflea prorocentri]MCY6381125.1 glyoxalase superfamily protein [Hoeflea prorocentri]MDA5398925.1 glyoxalase superfamily protein [Hoeflea prorocentri]
MDTTTIENCTPFVRVASMKLAIPFYSSIGFKEDWRRQFDSAFPIFLSVSRDGVRLFLSEHAGDGVLGTRLFLNVSDVDHFHAECVSNGVSVDEAPQDMAFGVRQMSLRDVDGNVLVFATPLPRRLF